MSRVRPWIASCLFLALSACIEEAPAAAEENEVLAVIARLDSAWNTKDRATVEQLFAPTYVYFSSKGAVVPRDSALASLMAPHYHLEYADRSELEVRQQGASAVVASRWRGRGSWEGSEFVDDQRCSLVLSRSTGRWQLLSEHCTQIAT